MGPDVLRHVEAIVLVVVVVVLHHAVLLAPVDAETRAKEPAGLLVKAVVVVVLHPVAQRVLQIVLVPVELDVALRALAIADLDVHHHAEVVPEHANQIVQVVLDVLVVQAVPPHADLIALDAQALVADAEEPVKMDAIRRVPVVPVVPLHVIRDVKTAARPTARQLVIPIAQGRATDRRLLSHKIHLL